MASDPTHQFVIKKIIDLNIAGYDLSFTNSSLWMLLSVVTVIFLLTPRKSADEVPGRFAMFQETLFNMGRSMVTESVGKEGEKYFPLIFTLFLFVLFSNLAGMLPYSFTSTSHLAVTGVLAAGVLALVLIVGIANAGLGYFKHFAPAGLPFIMYFLVVPIEIISFMARPVTLAIRLCANMAAGHIVLKIFASFIVMLAGAGSLAALGILPFAMLIALNALELFVAFLQAYIFATLTCIYLSESVHISH